jgi:sulfite reductase (ferredoxin)
VNQAAHESKAQRVERLKRALNPWQALEEIERFARQGHASIPPEWGTYFRWWGIYSQGDGRGALGGAGGEGRAVPYFMVRIRIPNGFLRADQLRAIAELTERHARGVADLTVRQNVQLHWIAVEALPEVLGTLARVGLTTMGSCGDDTRNITGCPLAGVDAEEIADASPLVEAATRMLNGNPDFYNLPRKFKVTITGCAAWCTYPEINDVGFTALPGGAGGPPAFAVRVGGGLSTEPHLARRLPALVAWDDVLPVLRALAELFRDSAMLRQSREKARLKYLFLQHGWTAERVLAEVERRLGRRLPPAGPETAPADVYRDHVGVHPQRRPGTYYAGFAVLRGRISAAELGAAAGLAERHGGGQLRLTAMQSLLVIDVPEAALDALRADARAAGLRLAASPFRRGAVACTGVEFCKLALTETKGFTAGLVEELERRLPGWQEHLKLHVTGCPNSCGQHWIADLGLEGKKVKLEGRLVDAYYFCVGGGLGRDAATARPVGFRAPVAEVPAAIERLLRAYLAGRAPGESFRGFCARHDTDTLRALLAGSPTAAVPRDRPAGPVPHGLEV